MEKQTPRRLDPKRQLKHLYQPSGKAVVLVDVPELQFAAFAEAHGYAFRGPHHEIYLGDPRTAKPENLKTVLRHGVTRVE